jgi:BlaI family penicillinase repressor
MVCQRVVASDVVQRTMLGRCLTLGQSIGGEPAAEIEPAKAKIPLAFPARKAKILAVGSVMRLREAFRTRRTLGATTQMKRPDRLSARERQIMDLVYAKGEATATEVLQALPDPPSRNAVRTFLRILEEKGHLRHRSRGREYVFRPTRPRTRAGQSAVQHVLKTFFNGSLEKAVAVHLANPAAKVSPDELKRLEDLIREAREEEGS